MKEIKRVADFLDTYSSASTRAGYSTAISNFFSFIYNYKLIDRSKRKDKEFISKQRADIEVLASRYFLEGRDYAEDLKNFNTAYARDYSPKSCQYYHSAIREFFIFHDVEFTEKESRAIRKRVKQGGAITEEHYLTREEIWKIFMQCSLKVQTIILLQASSGIRPGKETETLYLQDVKLCLNDGTEIAPTSELEPDYGTILIRAEHAKNHIQRVTFCSKEAAGYLKVWLAKGRDEYLKGTGKYQGHFTPDTSKRQNYVFPFTYTTYWKSVKIALERAGMFKRDPTTRRATIHPHNFRKFFETQMYRVINPKTVEKLVGHESELSRVYINFTDQDLREDYQRGEYTVTILTDVPEKMAQSKEEIREMRDQVRDTQIENLMTKSKLDEMERKNTELSTRLNGLHEMERRMAALEKLLGSQPST